MYTAERKKYDGDAEMGYISETHLTVRYAETDRMGIVHHSRYYPWFEVARTEFIKKSGMSYSEMEKMGLWLPLSESSAKYLYGLEYEDEVLIKTKLVKLSYARCEFAYEVYREIDNKLMTTGKTIHGFTDPNLKPLNLKKRFPQIWDKLTQLLTTEDK